MPSSTRNGTAQLSYSAASTRNTNTMAHARRWPRFARQRASPGRWCRSNRSHSRRAGPCPAAPLPGSPGRSCSRWPARPMMVTARNTLKRLDVFRPGLGFDRHQRRQRHHVVLCGAHIQAIDRVGQIARAGVGLGRDLVGAAEHVEVVDVAAAKECLQRARRCWRSSRRASWRARGPARTRSAESGC